MKRGYKRWWDLSTMISACYHLDLMLTLFLSEIFRCPLRCVRSSLKLTNNGIVVTEKRWELGKPRLVVHAV
jgi:hypothetical protein